MATSRRKHPQARRFRPPLKASSNEPSPDRSPQNKYFSHTAQFPSSVGPCLDDSLVQDCEVDGIQISNNSLESLDSLDQCDRGSSLPGTQTHTVLSYCENYQTDDINYISNDFSSHCSNTNTSSSEESDDTREEIPTRFRAHKPTSNVQRRFYDYQIVPNRKRSVADVERKATGSNRGGKRVCIMTPLVTKEKRRAKSQRHLYVPDHKKDVCEEGAGLSVYDYQPTPQESKEQAVDEGKRGRGRKISNLKMDASACGYTGSVEEQV